MIDMCDNAKVSNVLHASFSNCFQRTKITYLQGQANKKAAAELYESVIHSFKNAVHRKNIFNIVFIPFICSINN